MLVEYFIAFIKLNYGKKYQEPVFNEFLEQASNGTSNNKYTIETVDNLIQSFKSNKDVKSLSRIGA